MRKEVAWIIAASLAWAASARAGGHFDVDDAGTAAPGECFYEVWGGHGNPRSVDFFHLGPACGVGPVELGLNLDLAKGERERVDLLGPQVKWNFFGREAGAPLAAAVSAGAIYDVRRNGRWGGQLLLPITWQALPSLAVNGNLGFDWGSVDGERTGRAGLGVEWALDPKLSLLAEQNHAFSLWTTRVGLRWNITPQLSLDASVARVHASEGIRLFTVGLNQSFSRP